MSPGFILATAEVTFSPQTSSMKETRPMSLLRVSATGFRERDLSGPSGRPR